MKILTRLILLFVCLIFTCGFEGCATFSAYYDIPSANGKSPVRVQVEGTIPLGDWFKLKKPDATLTPVAVIDPAPAYTPAELEQSGYVFRVLTEKDGDPPTPIPAAR
jgi:hypothetical protein